MMVIVVIMYIVIAVWAGYGFGSIAREEQDLPIKWRYLFTLFVLFWPALLIVIPCYVLYIGVSNWWRWIRGKPSFKKDQA